MFCVSSNVGCVCVLYFAVFVHDGLTFGGSVAIVKPGNNGLSGFGCVTVGNTSGHDVDLFVGEFRNN